MDVNDTLRYRLLGNGGNGMFRVDASNGSVYWRPPQTAEKKVMLTQALQAYENGQRDNNNGLSFEV